MYLFILLLSDLLRENKFVPLIIPVYLLFILFIYLWFFKYFFFLYNVNTFIMFCIMSKIPELTQKKKKIICKTKMYIYFLFFVFSRFVTAKTYLKQKFIRFTRNFKFFVNSLYIQATIEYFKINLTL